MPVLALSPQRCLPLLAFAVALTGCNQLPRSGPTSQAVAEVAGGSPAAGDAAGVVQLVDIDEAVARRLAGRALSAGFAETLGDAPVSAARIGPGDAIEMTIWETPPAALFGAPAPDPRLPGVAQATVLPVQIVDPDGLVSVPFVGRVGARGKTTSELATAVAAALKGKANQPQVIVRLAQNASSTVAVVGEVSSNLRLPLTAAGERVLDAIAAAGGPRQPVSKVSIQLTRGQQLRTLPMDTVIRDPRQNVRLLPGDVVTVLFQPQSFVALGATGRQDEIPFEAQGITLAQALGRMGGLNDSRSDARGIFIFRFEPRDALASWPREPVTTVADGLVPVVYRLDAANPAAFFAMQSFPMQHRDIVFVSNSPVADLQKFLNVVFSITYPVLNAANALK